MEIRASATQGVLWSIAGRGGRQLLRLLVMVGLARLLAPEDFGLVAMIAVVSGFATTIADLGLVPALVSAGDLERAEEEAAFTLSVVWGTALTVLFAASSPLIALLYGEPRLIGLAVLLSLQFVLASLDAVPMARLMRDLSFDRLAIVDPTAALLAGLFGMGAAVLGLGPWSLVIFLLMLQAFTTLGHWLACGHSTGWHWDVAIFGRLWNVAGGAFGFNAINYWARTFDDLAVGRVFGASPLGLYNRAYEFLLGPISEIQAVVGRVVFPSLSRMQDDQERLADAYLQVVGVISLIAFPAMAGLAVVAEEFVIGVLGRQWEGAIPLVRVFAIVGVLQSIGTTTGWLYQATGATRRMFGWGVAATTATIIAVLIGLHWDVLGVATAYAVTVIVLLPFNLSFAGRIVGLSATRILRRTMLIAAASGVMASFVFGISSFLPVGFGPLLKLTILSVLGALFYWALLHLITPRPYRDLQAVFATLIRSKSA